MMVTAPAKMFLMLSTAATVALREDLGEVPKAPAGVRF